MAESIALIWNSNTTDIPLQPPNNLVRDKKL